MAMELVRRRLPPSWSVAIEDDPSPLDHGYDGIMRLGSPDGHAATLLFEAKRLLSTRDVANALEQLRSARLGMDPDVVPLLAARYLAPSTRERIAEAGGNYVDATGNMLLSVDRPALFIAEHGADRDPWRGPGRPRGTLKGAPAARVVRALIDFAPPYTVPDLCERAGASTGATYRVVEFLEEEELVERKRYGPIMAVRWRKLLTRWSEDYGFAQSNTVETYLEPRGLDALLTHLAMLRDVDYSVTGSLAAERVAPFAPPKLGMLYVRDLADAARVLGLRRVEGGGANVALAAGKYDVAFDRTETLGGVRYAALSQVAVDLLTGPGRNPIEGIELLDWMEANEPSWRR